MNADKIRAAVEAGLNAAIAALVEPEPSPPEAPGLPLWCSTEEYAAWTGKKKATIQRYAKRAPRNLARKYGRDWRLAGPAFDAWVQNGGPFRMRQHETEGKVH